MVSYAPILHASSKPDTDILKLLNKNCSSDMKVKLIWTITKSAIRTGKVKVC